jgi:hypothetical protein
MIISRVSVEDLEAARDVASQLLGNELVFPEHHIYGPKRHGLRLQVRDIAGPGLSAKNSQQRRCVPSCASTVAGWGCGLLLSHNLASDGQCKECNLQRS